jgi:hypothetical protein
MSQRRLAVTVLAGSAMFIASLTVFWFVWAAADAVPTAHPAAWPRMAFLVVSFPVFSVATKSVSTQYFWQLATLNSFVWALAAGFATWKATAR